MKGNKIWKKALSLVLALTMVFGTASPVVAAHEHETAAEIVTEITNATIKEAEKVIDKAGLLDAADVTDTKNALEEADSNLAGSMDNLGTAVENAEAAIDALDGKVTKDDAIEINESLSAAYNEATDAYADAVAASDAALEELASASEAYDAANEISDETAKIAETELKAAQEALNAAVEAAKFANDNMTNLKNEFAKATELASKWNAEAEAALAEATAKFEEAKTALDNALAALETENAELKAAIDTFKACYDAFITAANTFKTSIQTAIDAQDKLEALYAEYEAAQVAYAEALAAYEAKCAEYEVAGYPADYDTFKAETERLDAELVAANEDLAEAQNTLLETEKVYKFYEDRVVYFETLEEQNNILTSETATEEEKAEAAYNTAEIIVEQFIVAENIANEIWSADTQIVKAPAEGSEYGKSANPFFVVIGENVATRDIENGFVLRYGYEVNAETGAVEVFELVAVDVTNYIEYNGVKYELEENNDGLYITVDGSKVDIYKDGTRYFEKITLDGQLVEDNTKVPEKVDALIVAKALNINLGDVLSYWVELKCNEETGTYYFSLPLLGDYPVDVEQDEETGKYTVTYNYEVEIKAEECSAPLHKDGKHYVHKVCTVHEFDEQGNCIKNCIVDEHNTIGHDAEGNLCRVESHYVDGEHQDSCGHEKYEGKCISYTCNKSSHISHEIKNGKVYGITKYGKDIFNTHSISYLECDYKCEISECEYTSCDEKWAGLCVYETIGTEQKSVEVSCKYPVEKPQAEYEDAWYDVVGNKIVVDENTTINFTESVNGESYTYQVNVKFVEGGDADTFFARKVSRNEGIFEDLASLTQKRADALAAYETAQAELETAETAQADAQAIYDDYSAKLVELEEVYNVYKEAEKVATEKELGELADLPKNISELVEGMEVEEMLTLLEAIIELSSQSDDVDYEKVLEVLSDVVDSSAAARLIWVLGYDAVDDGLDSILPFGLFDDIMGGIEDVVGGLIDKLTPPTEFEREYANAWVDALTTKIKVVQNAIKLVESAVDTIEAGVTAVTEGIELAEVAADAILATAEKKMLEAVVDVLVMANDILGTSEEVVLSIDSIIAEAQARTEKAYLVALAEQSALSKVVLSRPYATELDNALVAIGSVHALNNELLADIALAEAPLATAKALYEELKVLEEHEHNYESVTTDPNCTEEGSIVYTCTICTDTYTEVLDALGHDYEAVVTAPTCTEAGYTTYTCTACDDSYVADEVEATGHDYESVVTNPSCTAGGHTTHTCKVCGDSYVDTETDKTAHVYATETVEATCEEDGYVIYACTGCEDTYTVVLKALGHNYELTDSKPATCTTDGSNVYTCTNCKDVKSEVVTALGHAYETVVTAPTCEEDGYTTYTCTVCGDNYVADEVEATGHSYELTDSKPATCTADGSNVYTCASCKDVKREVVSKTGHNYELTDAKPATCLADGSNIYTCTGCKDVKKEVLAATGHDYKVVVTEATCTAGGYTTYTCACGDSYITDEVEALGHNFEAEVTAPTCTAGGYTTYTCSTCKESYKDDEVAANGHTWGEWELTKEATEAEYGEQIRYCTVAGCDASELEKINKLPHTHVMNVSEVIAPTCTTGGYTIYTCVCGETETRDYVDALGHEYEAVVTAPTCTEVGYTTYTCACGDSYVADEVAALGHGFGEWEVTKEATEFEAGIETRACACGATETQEIAAIGHTYTAEVTAPTCTEEGYTTYTCECGHSYVADYVEALGHTEDAVVTAPTCTEEGYTTYTCSVCGESRKADTISALGHDYIPTVTKATCTAEGYTTYTCSRGDHSYVADYVEALGHSFGEWTVEESATCTEKGAEARICATCGEEETRVIEALGHKYDAVVTEATCTVGGHTTYVCACGSYETGLETEALGHTWGAWVVTTEATETATGLETRECATCHATEENVLAMLESAPVVDETVEIEDEETPLADGEEVKEDETIVIEDEETPLASGSEMVEIDEEEVPLASGAENSNIGVIVATVGGVAVVGTGAAVVATQAGAFGTGAATSAAATGTTAGATGNSIVAAITAFFKKLFRK